MVLLRTLLNSILLLTLLAGATEAAGAPSARQLKILTEAENAIGRNEDLSSLVNLRFFGTYAGTDQYIKSLEKNLCARQRFEKIPALLSEQKESFPHADRVFRVMTQMAEKLDNVSIQKQMKTLRFKWSYQHFLEDIGTLDCVYFEGRRQAESEALLMVRTGLSLLQLIPGYKDADQIYQNAQKRLKGRLKAWVDEWEKEKAKKHGVMAFDLLDISLGMPFEVVFAYHPDVEVVRDYRGTSRQVQMVLKYVKPLRIGKEIQLEITLRKINEEQEPKVTDISYRFDLAGLAPKKARIVLEKLFEKYPSPVLDYTSIPKPFHINHFAAEYTDDADTELKYCWGDCTQKTDELEKVVFLPGKRLLMNYNKLTQLLTLHLYDDSYLEQEETEAAISEDNAESQNTPVTDSESDTKADPSESATNHFDPSALFDQTDGDELQF